MFFFKNPYFAVFAPKCAAARAKRRLIVENAKGKITLVLFDLDGTLLPMDQELFIKAYFGGIAARLAPRGYEPQALIKAIWTGTGAMVKNDGLTTNESAFWNAFSAVYGPKAMEDEPYFDQFYREDFDGIKKVCGFTAESDRIIKLIRGAGVRVALATNPIFPAIATQKRMAWAGLDRNDFELVTTYENSSFCKPNLKYYEEILKKLSCCPEECLMVGNDVGEDMVAKNLGMKVFLLTDCLINKSGEDLSAYSHGTFNDLEEYLKKYILA